jgi:hypothetical protein
MVSLHHISLACCDKNENEYYRGAREVGIRKIYSKRGRISVSLWDKLLVRQRIIDITSIFSHLFNRMYSVAAILWRLNFWNTDCQDTGYRIQDTRYRIQVTEYRIQDTGYRIQDTGYRIQDTRYKIQDTGDRIPDTGYRIQDTGYRIQDTGYRIQDTGYRIQDTGYRIQDTGYRIQDTGYRIQDTGYEIQDTCLNMNASSPGWAGQFSLESVSEQFYVKSIQSHAESSWIKYIRDKIHLASWLLYNRGCFLKALLSQK